jgi:glycosyltransferase involved in cell wall biosynthesis
MGVAELSVNNRPAERAGGRRISVVIPSIGRDSMGVLREALGRQSRKPDEIIIVRDEERRGSGWARNQGIKRSQGDLIAFIDDDCEPPADWLERLVAAVDLHDAAGAGGTYLETDPFLRDIRRRRGFPDAEQEDSVGWVGAGGNVVYKRSWLERLERRDGHVFNESFAVSQDIELSWRLRGFGARIVYVPVRVKHHRHLTPLGYLSFQFKRGTGIARLFSAQRADPRLVAAQKSLIWNPGGKTPGKNWLRAFWSKGLGPFDMGSFGRKRDFLLFWIGEKIQVAGFFWGLARIRPGAIK